MNFFKEQPRLELIELMQVRPSIIQGELKELAEEIEEKIKEVYAPANRCWWTCIKLVKALSKKWRNNLVLAESETHYWLEYKGNPIDPHYYIIGETLFLKEYKKTKVNEIPITEVLKAVRPLREGYEERPAFKLSNHKEHWVKIPSIEL